jgi:hypothetical protein
VTLLTGLGAHDAGTCFDMIAAARTLREASRLFGLPPLRCRSLHAGPYGRRKKQVKRPLKRCITGTDSGKKPPRQVKLATGTCDDEHGLENCHTHPALYEIWVSATADLLLLLQHRLTLVSASGTAKQTRTQH